MTVGEGMDQAGFDREIERNYRWNFIVNVLDASFFFFGMSFIAESTVIPVYVSRLTSSRVLIGLVSAIASAGWFLPQLLTANGTERLSRKKPLVVQAGLLAERLPILLLALSAYLFAGRAPGLALGLFFLFYSWHRLGSGAMAPAWEDMIAKIIPLDRRGRFFGIANFGGALLGIAGAQLTTHFLARYAFPNNFALCMFFATGGILLSWVFLALTREPARTPNKEHVSNLTYLRRRPQLVKADVNFSRYLFSRMLAGMGRMAVGLTTVYAVERWALPDQQAGVYTVILLVTQMLCNLLFGYLGDHKGHKLSLELGLLAWAGSMAVAYLAPTPFWFYLAFVAAGVATSGELVAGLMILLEFSAPEDRPTYIGLGNSTTGIFNAIAPLLGGLLASWVGFQPLFVISLLITLAAWAVLRYRVQEPRSLAHHQIG